MPAEHDTDALDALVAGEPVADRARLDAHLAGCDDCARELAWLRAEQRLLRSRERDEPAVDSLWRGVAARLPDAVAANPSPYRAAAPPPAAPERRPWRAFAAGFAAAALLGVGVAALTRKVGPHESVAHRARRGVDPAHAPALSPVRAEVASPVSGPVRLHLEAWSAEVRVVGTVATEVRVRVRGLDATPRVVQRSDGRHDVVFDGGRLVGGAVEVAVPRGSSADVTTASGDVTLEGGLGAVRVTTTAGNVRALEVGDAVVTTSSGDLVVGTTGARVRVRTVSGDAQITQGPMAQVVDVETTSGDIAWSGGCARGCRFGARSVSGDVRLTPRAESGFTLGFTTVSGEFTDGVDRAVTPVGVGGPTTVRRGSGEGAIDVTTTSGSLIIASPAAR
jgi:hypothetical protein